jgi:hypothetical protein
MAKQSTKRDPLLADYLPERDAAKELRQSLRTLRAWRERGVGPGWLKIGRRVFYGRGTIMSWVQSQERQPVRASAG